MSLWKDYNHEPQPDVPLAPLTTWRIGGNAQWFAEPSDAGELAHLLTDVDAMQIRPYILGGGSNILICEGTLNGIVIRIGKGFSNIEVDAGSGIMRLGAGVTLAKALAEAERHELSGLESLAGIPGSIGGAVMMNAGGEKNWIGKYVSEIDVLTMGGHFDRYRRDNLFFSYRHSNLERLIITEVILRLKKGKMELIQQRKSEALAAKRESQPLQLPSAGCVFKNPEGMSAGQLIDEAGCKGLKCGGAAVSDLHANYFINTGGATCDEMLELINIVRNAVERNTGVMLELEVKLWL